MKQARLRGEKDFCVVLRNRRSQAAEMVLPAGESEGSSDNRHPEKLFRLGVRLRDNILLNYLRNGADLHSPESGHNLLLK
jgi:hypothetical protein